jgi:formiminotetrahydrofolate cyclodeaminase
VLRDKTVQGFLDELASSSPAPGGGSTAALAGAVAAGLVSMVCRLTIGKKGYETVEQDMLETLEKSEKIRDELTLLIDEDTKAFDEVMLAFKLPKETDDEKRKRSAAIQKGYKTAAQVPLRTAQVCTRLWTLVSEVADKGNKNSITDAGVAGLLTYSGIMGAILNVKINLGAIKDEGFTAPVDQEIREIEEDASNYLSKIMRMINI